MVNGSAVGRRALAPSTVCGSTLSCSTRRCPTNAQNSTSIFHNVIPAEIVAFANEVALTVAERESQNINARRRYGNDSSGGRGMDR